uniref:Cadherin domain-containing protein n=1 Tax=Bubo bubo TaxID=30461 RepID=A0A8C0FI92_BUBBB
MRVLCVSCVCCVCITRVLCHTGALDVVSPLDYEVSKEFTLRIRAQDGGRPPLSNISGLVTVQVLDVNDNAPIFVSTPFQATVLENVPVGYSVIHVQAIDADSGDNGRLVYTLLETGAGFPFAINNSTGWIVVASELDREAVDFYSFGVEAQDQGSPPMASSASVSILVSDVNDNAPQFLRDSYQGSVYEDVPAFTSVLQVSATDRDSGLNGRVFYTFQGGDDGDGDFIIESTSGIVRTLRRLDRENVPLYSLRAFAVDKGVPAKRTPVEIQVTVLDVNDNPPVFERDEFDIFVEENSPIGLVVARITATDPDEGTNAQIMYQIVEGNIPEVFQLDIFSGELTALADLDYESKMEAVGGPSTPFAFPPPATALECLGGPVTQCWGGSGPCS